MNDSVEIREARPADVMGILNVLHKAWLDTYPNAEIGVTVDDVEDSYKDSFKEESIRKMEAGLANIPKNQRRLVAVCDGVIVGVTTMVRNEENNQLRTIYILPEFQGKGIGRRLYAEAAGFCDLSKDTIVQVATYNDRAIDFYKKLGFIDTGKRFSEERFRMKSGAIIPEMELVKKTSLQ